MKPSPALHTTPALHDIYVTLVSRFHTTTITPLGMGGYKSTMLGGIVWALLKIITIASFIITSSSTTTGHSWGFGTFCFCFLLLYALSRHGIDTAEIG